MTRYNRLAGLAAALGGAILLAGCAGSPFSGMIPGTARSNVFQYENDLAALKSATQPNPTTFPATLASEYQQFATSEADQGDYVSADYFARKGLMAAHGTAVPPETVANWNIPASKRGELEQARSRLVSDLDAGGRDRFAPLAARAQERYDCWVEQQEENFQISDISSCRSQFLAALNDLESQLHPTAPAAQQAVPPAAEREYRVYFEFDKATLTPAAKQIVDRVASELRGGGTGRIELVGKADRAGPTAYNQRLSQRRSKTVLDALVADGIARDRIEARAVGETQPPVPTPDGVREPRNRVVTITVH